MTETNRLYAAEGQRLMQERDVSKATYGSVCHVITVNRLFAALRMSRTECVCSGSGVFAPRGSPFRRGERSNRELPRPEHSVRLIMVLLFP